MLIKQQALKQHLKSKLNPVYLLIGQDNYLINESQRLIKAQIKATHHCDESRITLQTVSDWQQLNEEAHSYSLFSETMIIEASYEKKTLDVDGKRFLTEYLKSINSRCFIILQAPQLQAKTLQWLSSNNQATIVQSFALDAEGMKQWLNAQLREQGMTLPHDVSELIIQYTKGNMLATSQFVEKISLTYPEAAVLTADMALEHLSDQSEHSLYELIDSLLLGKSEFALQLLRKAAQTKTEPTLALWMFTQDLRNLSQLQFRINNGVDLQTACDQLGIWSQKQRLYQVALKRLSQRLIQSLLMYCQLLDERIKSNSQELVWLSLENLALSITVGKPMGDVCKI